jgi:hypothetical protein
MEYQYIRQAYKVNPIPGCRIRMLNKIGTILLPRPGSEHYVNVLFDGEFRESLCHPTWEMTYLGIDAPAPVAPEPNAGEATETGEAKGSTPSEEEKQDKGGK